MYSIRHCVVDANEMSLISKKKPYVWFFTLRGFNPKLAYHANFNNEQIQNLLLE